MAMAKTGSGKSASFILPILELWSKNVGEEKAKIKALILTPTRELTLQIAEAFNTFAIDLDKKPKVVSVIGGEGIGEQLYAIQQGCDILVATSGRLLDVVRKKQMNLSHIEFFVLDEKVYGITMFKRVLLLRYCNLTANIFQNSFHFCNRLFKRGIFR